MFAGAGSGSRSGSGSGSGSGTGAGAGAGASAAKRVRLVVGGEREGGGAFSGLQLLGCRRDVWLHTQNLWEKVSLGQGEALELYCNTDRDCKSTRLPGRV